MRRARTTWVRSRTVQHMTAVYLSCPSSKPPTPPTPRPLAPAPSPSPSPPTGPGRYRRHLLRRRGGQGRPGQLHHHRGRGRRPPGPQGHGAPRARGLRGRARRGPGPRRQRPREPPPRRAHEGGQEHAGGGEAAWPAEQVGLVGRSVGREGGGRRCSELLCECMCLWGSCEEVVSGWGSCEWRRLESGEK